MRDELGMRRRRNKERYSKPTIFGDWGVGAASVTFVAPTGDLLYSRILLHHHLEDSNPGGIKPLRGQVFRPPSSIEGEGCHGLAEHRTYRNNQLFASFPPAQNHLEQCLHIFWSQTYKVHLFFAITPLMF